MTCLLWKGARTRGGYGLKTIRGKQYYTHRLAWEAIYGPIPGRFAR